MKVYGIKVDAGSIFWTIVMMVALAWAIACFASLYGCKISVTSSNDSDITNELKGVPCDSCGDDPVLGSFTASIVVETPFNSRVIVTYSGCDVVDLYLDDTLVVAGIVNGDKYDPPAGAGTYLFQTECRETGVRSPETPKSITLDS